MDASKFTTRSQEAINAAISSAAAAGHAQVEAVHLLAALLAQPEGVIAPLLEAVGVQPSRPSRPASRAELAQAARRQRHHGRRPVVLPRRDRRCSARPPTSPPR